MMNLSKKEPLDISHKSCVVNACAKLHLPFSEYNFSNLYLFRKIHDYFLLHFNADRKALLASSYSKQHFLMPLFQPEDWEELISVAKSLNASYLYPLSEAWGPFPEEYAFTSSDDDSDYLFERETLATYHGRHLDGQRNAVRGLLSKHTVSVIPFSESDIPSALEIVDAWAKDSGGARSDREECKEGIQLATTLGIEGLIVEVDGKKRGLILGEPLTADTFVIHFAKTSVPLHGLYAYMHQELAKKILPQFKWMNWEQDLGLEALRHSKRSYHPTNLVKKGRLQITS